MSVDTSAGTYLLVVEQSASCVGASGDGGYKLDIEAGWDPLLTQTREDVQINGEATWVMRGPATLAK